MAPLVGFPLAPNQSVPTRKAASNPPPLWLLHLWVHVRAILLIVGVVMFLVWRISADNSESFANSSVSASSAASSTEEHTDRTGTLVVGNTDGDGAYIHVTPSLDNRITAWSDGTEVQSVGKSIYTNSRWWDHVQDPAGNVGWMASEYLAIK